MNKPSIIFIVIITAIVCFILGILFCRRIYKKKHTIDGILYCGINKDGRTWMGLQAYDPARIFLQGEATFKVVLRDQYNSYIDEKEELHHERRD